MQVQSDTAMTGIYDIERNNCWNDDASGSLPLVVGSILDRRLSTGDWL